MVQTLSLLWPKSLSNKDANGWVVADAVQFVSLDDSGEEKQKLNCQKTGVDRHFSRSVHSFYYGFESSKHQSVVTIRFA